MLEILNHMEFTVFLFAGFGLLLGSFANVLIYRIPEGKAFVLGRSQCRNCNQKIAWYDNIPVISWLVLRGKCRNCKKNISWRYPAVEILMSVAFALVFFTIGWSWFLLEALIFVFGLIVVSFIDFDHMILPDSFTLSGIVIGLLGSLINPERDFWPALLGVLVGGGVLWFIAYLYWALKKEEGMGGGDIKLLAWIGAVLGWSAIPFVIMTSSLMGSFIGIIVALNSKKGFKQTIPFGPYLALAAILYLVGGQALSDWYLQLFIPSLGPVN